MRTDLLATILNQTRPAVTYVHPILDLRTGQIQAKEVLTRFVDEDGRLRTVGDLLADTTLAPELRVQLDLICLAAIFDTLAVHPITDHLLFLNVSPLTLAYEDLWTRLNGWVWHLAIPPHRIVLEITESQHLHGLDGLAAYVDELRRKEFRIAVDDVGSGVASLAHVARLRPDFIKIDQSLVRNVHQRPFQAALMEALAGFAQRMNVGFIAEGIETVEELEALRAAGVPMGQGFLFGEPEPLSIP